MKLVLAYSHHDVHLAEKLILWIKHLGGVPVPLVVVSTQYASRMNAHLRIKEILEAEFPGAHSLLVMDEEDERGWPWSASHMFGWCLRHIDDDIFWIEPDCVPLKRGWFEALHAEFKRLKKTFVGRLVPHDGVHNKCVPHMTGCSFYGKNWKKIVPGMGQVRQGASGAWDIDWADEMMKDFADTKLVHHYWIRGRKDLRVPLASIEPQAVIYHQCKLGELFDQLDPTFATSPLTLRWNRDTNPINLMTRYFLTENANADYKVAGRQIVFTPTHKVPQSNSWWGTLKTDDPDLLDKLETLLVTNRVSEISEEDYEKFELKKKKENTPRTSIALKNPLDEPVLRNVAPAAPNRPVVDAITALTPRAARKK